MFFFGLLWLHGGRLPPSWIETRVGKWLTFGTFSTDNAIATARRTLSHTRITSNSWLHSRPGGLLTNPECQSLFAPATNDENPDGVAVLCSLKCIKYDTIVCRSLLSLFIVRLCAPCRTEKHPFPEFFGKERMKEDFFKAQLVISNEIACIYNEPPPFSSRLKYPFVTLCHKWIILIFL